MCFAFKRLKGRWPRHTTDEALTSGRNPPAEMKNTVRQDKRCIAGQAFHTTELAQCGQFFIRTPTECSGRPRRCLKRNPRRVGTRIGWIGGSDCGMDRVPPAPLYLGSSRRPSSGLSPPLACPICILAPFRPCPHGRAPQHMHLSHWLALFWIALLPQLASSGS